MQENILMIKNIFFIFIALFMISSCSDTEKIRSLKKDLSSERQTSQQLWSDRSNLRNELSKIKASLERSNRKIYSFQKDQQFTKDMIALLANGQSKEAISIAKTIDQGWFDEIDRQMISQNKILADMKAKEKIREEEQNNRVKNREKEFYEFILSIIILLLKSLVVGVLLVCFILIGFLIYKGKGTTDKLIRAGGVIAFLMLYFLSSFSGYSISSLMLSSIIIGFPLLSIGAHWIIPFIVGGVFAGLLRKQLIEREWYAERWIIVIITLLFCMLLDVFLKVETNIGDQSVPIANATFVAGLFLTLFFTLKPKDLEKIEI